MSGVVAELLAPDEEAMGALAAALAPRLAPGDCLQLDGELGAGKTVFVRGLAAARGVARDEVTSPSFTLVQSYVDSRGAVIVHADAFRLGASAEAAGLDLDEPPDRILVVEWGARIAGWLQPDRLCVTITSEAGGLRVLALAPTGARAQALAAAWVAGLPRVAPGASGAPRGSPFGVRPVG